MLLEQWHACELPSPLLETACDWQLWVGSVLLEAPRQAAGPRATLCLSFLVAQSAPCTFGLTLTMWRPLTICPFHGGLHMLLVFTTGAQSLAHT
jgi:hypothetical protein